MGRDQWSGQTLTEEDDGYGGADLRALLYGTGAYADETPWGRALADELDDRLAGYDPADIGSSPMSLAAREFARELTYGPPEPEIDLPRDERPEDWELTHGVTGEMPARYLQREVRIHGGGGSSSGGGKAKKPKPRREKDVKAVDAPTIGWVPGPQLAIWVTRGTHAYFDRAPLEEATRAITSYVEQLRAAGKYPARPLPKRKRRARLLVVRGCPADIATFAKIDRGETSEALFEYALAHAAVLVRSLDGLGGA